MPGCSGSTAPALCTRGDFNAGPCLLGAFVIDTMKIALNYQHTHGSDIFLIRLNKEAVIQEHDRNWICNLASVENLRISIQTMAIHTA